MRSIKKLKKFFCRTISLIQCISLFVDKRVVLSLLLHGLDFSCPRSRDDDPARDCITHVIKVYAYNNNNNNNNNNNFHETRKYWVDVQQGIVFGNPSRDGVSIKILVWRHFKPTPQFMSELCLLNR